VGGLLYVQWLDTLLLCDLLFVRCLLAKFTIYPMCYYFFFSPFPIPPL